MDESERKEFGREIRAMRAGKGLTQKDLAARAGVGVRTIRNLEAGRNELQPGNLQSVLDALGYQRPGKPWDNKIEAALQMWGYRLHAVKSRSPEVSTRVVSVVTALMLDPDELLVEIEWLIANKTPPENA